MSTETQDPGPDISTRDGWRSLDREEQDAILQERMEQTPDSEDGPFEYAEPTPEEKQSAADLIEAKNQETWHGTVLGDVVMEFYTLQERHLNLIKEMATLFTRIQQADDVDDLSESDLDTLQEADEELEQMLADVCVHEERAEGPDAFSKGWWETGEYPGNLKLDVFSVLFEKYQQGGEAVKNSH